MPRRHPVNGIGVVRDADAVSANSCRNRTAPEPAAGVGPPARRRVSASPSGRHTAAPRSARPSGSRAPRRPRRGSRRGPPGAGPPPRLADPAAERVERADAARRQRRSRLAEPPRGGDRDPHPGEGAGAEPDRDPVDPLPAAGRRGGAPRPRSRRPVACRGRPAVGEPELRLVQDLAVAPGAGGGVRGRRVEADYEQGRAPLLPASTRKTELPTFLPLTYQVTVCTPTRRGDLVHVERPLFGRLGLGAEVFAAREVDADGVVDVGLEAPEEGALFALLRRRRAPVSSCVRSRRRRSG